MPMREHMRIFVSVSPGVHASGVWRLTLAARFFRMVLGLIRYNLRCRGTREEIRVQGESALAEDLAVVGSEIESDNAKASFRACKALLYDLMDADPVLQSANKPMAREDSTVPQGGAPVHVGVEISKLWSAWDACVATYEDQAKGPARESVLLEHGLKRLRDMNSSLADQAATALQKTADALEVQAHEAAALVRSRLWIMNGTQSIPIPWTLFSSTWICFSSPCSWHADEYVVDCCFLALCLPSRKNESPS